MTVLLVSPLFQRWVNVSLINVSRAGGRCLTVVLSLHFPGVCSSPFHMLLALWLVQRLVSFLFFSIKYHSVCLREAIFLPPFLEGATWQLLCPQAWTQGPLGVRIPTSEVTGGRERSLHCKVGQKSAVP